jgi:hypothetical protein
MILKTGILVILGAVSGFVVGCSAPRGVESGVDPNNTSYIIEGEEFKLEGGKNEKEVAPGAASRTRTAVWSGEPQYGDLDADGANDAVIILTQSHGGSGTFYYIAAALKDRKTNKYVGTNGVLLGDRIAPQNFVIEKGTVIVNYADRNPGEAFSVRPSVGITKRLHLDTDGKTFIEK